MVNRNPNKKLSSFEVNDSQFSSNLEAAVKFRSPVRKNHQYDFEKKVVQGQ